MRNRLVELKIRRANPKSMWGEHLIRGANLKMGADFLVCRMMMMMFPFIVWYTASSPESPKIATRGCSPS